MAKDDKSDKVWNPPTLGRWELIDVQEPFHYVERAPVPSGWLVRSTTYLYDDPSLFVHDLEHNRIHDPTKTAKRISVGLGLTFVPDPDHSWKVTPSYFSDK